MRQQERNMRLAQHGARDAAEYHFAQPAMAKGAHRHPVRLQHADGGLQRRIDGAPVLRPCVQLALDAMAGQIFRSEEHTSEFQSLMRSSYAVFCLKKKTNQ